MGDVPSSEEDKQEMITVGNESDGDEKDGDSEMSVNSSLDKAEASVKLNNPSPSVQDTLKQLFAVRKMAIEGLVLLNRNSEDANRVALEQLINIRNLVDEHLKKLK